MDEEKHQKTMILFTILDFEYLRRKASRNERAEENVETREA